MITNACNTCQNYIPIGGVPLCRQYLTVVSDVDDSFETLKIIFDVNDLKTNNAAAVRADATRCGVNGLYYVPVLTNE